MALLYESKLRARAQAYAKNRGYVRFDSALSEHLSKQEDTDSYDIFLSHAYEDRELILGAALTIEDLGFTVYLDWRNDADLSRSHVTYATASRLRERMKRSLGLLYCTTEGAESSKWMPWELGYKDGQNSRVAVLPVNRVRSSSNAYDGQEYLEIYPYVTSGEDTEGKRRLWVHRAEDSYIDLDKWLEGRNPYKRD